VSQDKQTVVPWTKDESVSAKVMLESLYTLAIREGMLEDAERELNTLKILSEEEKSRFFAVPQVNADDMPIQSRLFTLRTGII
jgi:hypothetical protein